MLEKPSLPDESIIVALQDEFGLRAAEVAFLPLGADQNTAAYRVVAGDWTRDRTGDWTRDRTGDRTGDGRACFLKLRRGVFDETSVMLPKLLFDQGIPQIIPPLAARTGRLWAVLGSFTMILYPYIEGRNGYEVALTDRQWVEFGAALRKIHTAPLPQALLRRIRRERYAPFWRQVVRLQLGQLDGCTYVDSIAKETAAFLKSKQENVLDLVRRAERLAQALQAHPPPNILCHSDLHAGNILVDASGAFYIVDWDDPILAPRERDLMYPGGAQGFIGHTPEEEEALFYQGYGPVRVDRRALAYYRYERIVQDIAIYSQQIFLTNEGGEDRQQALQYLKSNFLPNNTLEIAYRADRTQSAT